MPNSIATLLTRNLHEVFGEDDPGRRRTVIDELFAEDAVFYEPEGMHRGRDAIDRIAGVIRAAQPGLRYSPLRPPEEMHGAAGRIQWVAGRPGEAPAHAGTDVILARDGRIAAIYLFFDPVPA
ncbi:nuclear transport factor 2 family protein [Belnapia sp. T18]|uniref:Nuclear transport factor 2 family protein n=1 Tax=Belnapia arida TaxID=2804533 RepID=A0ABS1TXC9_9PROT|nr:nuclear transport factor 2 family protein [Belnapia arida]MBL6077087.1 nuclear transport factor 2 family protein [Belnapia arida]